MTWMNQLTDDQLALVGCGGALLAAFLVMTISYHVGALVRPTGARHTEPVAPGAAVRTEVAPLSQRTERRAA
jgi:hypothetical protein